jgi:hypothetical protein
MALLKAEAERLSNNILVAGMVETIITEDPLYALLDFERMNAKAMVYNREKALPSTAFLAPGGTVSESSGNTEEVIARLRAIIGDVDVDSFLDETMGNVNNQRATQIAMKTKATSRKFRDAVINGGAFSATITSGNPGGNFLTTVDEVSDPNGEGLGSIALDVTANTLTYTAPGDAAGTAVTYSANGQYVLKSASPSRWVKVTLVAANEGGANATIVITIAATNEFTGVKKFTPESQIIYAGTNGAALSFANLDELLDGVRGAKPDVILMARRTIRAYKALLRTTGGIEPAMIMDSRFDKPMLTYSGIPILENEFISTTEVRGSSGAVCTSAYALSLEPGYGVQGLYGGAQAGIRVENIGALETKDAIRTRVKWYTSLKLGSELAVARLAGITN